MANEDSEPASIARYLIINFSNLKIAFLTVLQLIITKLAHKGMTLTLTT